MIDKYATQSGFALLISLIVVGVVLSIGLVILDLTIKQVELAATTKDSETAFHAANAGVECARYWRRELSVSATSGTDLSGINCFGTSVSDVSPTNSDGGEVGDGGFLVNASDGQAAWQYEYDVTWGPTDSRRCTVVNMITVWAPALDSAGDPVTNDAVIELDTMRGLIVGYPDIGGDVTCVAGSQCTTMDVRGYNKACSAIGNFGVVERKVLLEF